MKRLRHPIRAIREPFGTAGLIIACIALVAALGGTAFAAAKLNSTQKKEVEKIAKKFAGKPGTNGSNGTNGSPGAAGKDGTNGTNGAPGANGKSVVASAAAVPGDCPTGTTGTKFEVEGSGSPSHVCGGKNGTPGAPGQPWTAGGTLPASTEPGCPCTETGAWLTQEEHAVISFPIPLAAGTAPQYATGETTGCEVPNAPVGPECEVHFINSDGMEINGLEEEVPASSQCPGSAADPQAAPGNLCVYSSTPGVQAADSYFANPDGGPTGAATAGIFLNVGPGGSGTWAVTAE